MPATLTVRDETTTGDVSDAITLEFLTDHITVRELIRERVYQEVKDYNAQRAQATNPVFRGLVQPTDAEQTLNGYKLKKPRLINWEPQFDKACDAFEANSILVLVDNQQAESLEQPITIQPGTEVSFLKLVPLVGG